MAFALGFRLLLLPLLSPRLMDLSSGSVNNYNIRTRLHLYTPKLSNNNPSDAITQLGLLPADTVLSHHLTRVRNSCSTICSMRVSPLSLYMSLPSFHHVTIAGLSISSGPVNFTVH